MWKPESLDALKRLGVSADLAAAALDGFPAQIHSVTDKIPLVGKALGDLANAAASADAQILAIPLGMGNLLINPWQGKTQAELDSLHAQQSEALKASGKTQADVDKHWNTYPGHAKGGIVLRPHVGLVGEARPEAIIPLDKAKPGMLGGSITINAPITISGAVTDQGNLAAILSEHAREIARQVKRALDRLTLAVRLRGRCTVLQSPWGHSGRPVVR
jgi:hypothetical protein